MRYAVNLAFVAATLFSYRALLQADSDRAEQDNSTKTEVVEEEISRTQVSQTLSEALSCGDCKK